jgi:hypothetical protein
LLLVTTGLRFGRSKSKLFNLKKIVGNRWGIVGGGQSCHGNHAMAIMPAAGF